MTYGDFSASNYLESLVQSAPPARLRLMLIEKAIGLCHLIVDRWKETPQPALWDGPNIQLTDILTELLSGVSRGDTSVAKQVADLYVFLIQHQNKAVESADGSMIDEIRIVLETEAETWRMVCAQLHTNGNTAINTNVPSTSPLHLDDAFQRRTPTEPLRPDQRASLSGSLNLQG
jgi:flagellar protein FliS